MFVNNNARQMKIIFADYDYKPRMLINILLNENYQCDRSEEFKVDQRSLKSNPERF